MEDTLLRLAIAGIIGSLTILFFLRTHRIPAWALLAISSALAAVVASNWAYRAFHMACTITSVYALVSETRQNREAQR
ncbi:hypothetical protein [Streptomyces microflavus]|uniref:hypothetical protein n=1 Tax=Streptomyces microflavus TaxID=1919 RepID=UPI0033F6FD25